MNRRNFVATLAAVPTLLFGRKHAVAHERCFDVIGHFRHGRRVDATHERFYTDVEVMFNDIIYHTGSTHDIVLPADDLTRSPPTLGFWAQPIGDGPGVGWSITTPDLAKSLKAMEERPDPVPPEKRWHVGDPGVDTAPAPPAFKAKVLRHYFNSAEGKSILARAFPGQRTDAEHVEAMKRWVRERGRGA